MTNMDYQINIRRDLLMYIPEKYHKLRVRDLKAIKEKNAAAGIAYDEEPGVIFEGWTADLLVEESNIRVWLERVGVDDGMPFDNGVTVEYGSGSHWYTVLFYEAR